MKNILLLLLLLAPACAANGVHPDAHPPALSVDPDSSPAIAEVHARTFAWTGDWLGDLTGTDGRTILLLPGGSIPWPTGPQHLSSGNENASSDPVQAYHPRLLAHYSLEDAPPGRYFLVTTLLYQGPTGEVPGEAIVRGTTIFSEIEALPDGGVEQVLAPVEDR